MFKLTNDSYVSAYDMFYYSQDAAPRETSRSVLGWMAWCCRRAMIRWTEKRRRNQTIRALSVLSDHQLNDIGVSRSAIPATAARVSSVDFVRYAAYR